MLLLESHNFEWHSELAFLANLNAMTCSPEKDKCVNTRELRWCSQMFNISSFVNPLINIEQSIIKWYEEALDQKADPTYYTM